MSQGKETDMDIPSEIVEDLQTFHENLKKMEEILQPLTTTNVNSLDVNLPPIERARLNLISGYALNALFYMYLNTLGEDPKNHKIKTELERYKSFMQTVKEITDKDKAPVLNKGAAKRFLRNALWEPKANDDPIETETPQHYMDIPSTSTDVNMEEGTDRNLIPQAIEINRIKIEEKYFRKFQEDSFNEPRNRSRKLRQRLDRKARNSNRKPCPILEGKDLSTLACGVCYISAVQLKMRGKFPVYVTTCDHFFCLPCLMRWKKTSLTCPTCCSPLKLPLGRPSFLV